MKIHATGEDIGVARQSHRSKESAVRTTPYANVLGIDIRKSLQVTRSGDHIFILGGPAPSAVGRLAEGTSVHDSQTIVHRKHHISQAGEILILRVGIVVVVHVMEAQKHLPRWTTMDKNERRCFGGVVSRDK